MAASLLQRGEEVGEVERSALRCLWRQTEGDGKGRRLVGVLIAHG
jgi:hypothetical protein